MEKYFIDYNYDKKEYRLYQEGEDQQDMLNVKSFASYKELVKYCKDELSKAHDSINILDYYHQGQAEFKDGEVTYVHACVIEEYDFMLAEWYGRKYDVEGYYEPSCSNCGDGGCFYCEPHRFL